MAKIKKGTHLNSILEVVLEKFTPVSTHCFSSLKKISLKSPMTKNGVFWGGFKFWRKDQQRWSLEVSGSPYKPINSHGSLVFSLVSRPRYASVRSWRSGLGFHVSKERRRANPPSMPMELIEKPPQNLNHVLILSTKDPSIFVSKRKIKLGFFAYAIEHNSWIVQGFLIHRTIIAQLFHGIQQG